MMARSHLPFAMACWWIVAYLMQIPITASNSLMAGVGGLLPDIDHPQSTVGRRIKFISTPIATIFGHRGMTHSIVALAAASAALYGVTQLAEYRQYAWVVMPVAVGYLSHLAGDSLTNSGIPLFWPLKKRYSLALFPTNTWAETVVAGGILLIVMGWTGVADDVFSEGERHFPTLFHNGKPKLIAGF